MTSQIKENEHSKRVSGASSLIINFIKLIIIITEKKGSEATTI